MATEKEDWPNRGKGAQPVTIKNLDGELKTTRSEIRPKSRSPDWERKETEK
jgi:hypothetical protein